MEELTKQLELAIAKLDRDLGRGSIIRLGNSEVEPWPAISTGAFSLDMALGIGGLPRGRIVEIYGPESSGKSTIALSVVAEAQNMGLRALYVDIEHGLDPGYMQKLGVKTDELLLSQPDSGEDALHTVDTLIKSGDIGVIVVDSVAALVPRSELDGEVSDSNVGGQARLMSKILRMIAGKAAKANTLVIFINQLRQKIGVIYGSPEVTSGGQALKFYASVRIDLRQKEKLKDDDGNFSGTKVTAKVVKNKMAPAYRITEFDILFGRGIDNLGCIADLAVKAGIIEKAASWYSYDGSQIGQGRNKVIEFLASDMVLADKMKGMILERSRN